MPASRGSYVKAGPTSGFDFMALALKDHFHATFPSTIKTISGVINTAFKHLKTSFFASLKGVSSAPSVPSNVTPSQSTPSQSIQQRSLPSRSRTIVQSFPTPVPFPPMDNYVTHDTSAAAADTVVDENPISQHHRLDQQYVAVSCANQAMRKLRFQDIVRLKHNDEFILFIPPMNKKKDPKAFYKACDDNLKKMRKIVMYDVRNTTTKAQRDRYWEAELQRRRVKRYGRFGHEFHVRVLAYPERARMEYDPIAESEKNNLILPETGVGVTVQLIGYSPVANSLLKLFDLALLELYTPKAPDEPIYDE
eukprot:scaffold52127_cov78-Cyclotella_meneghiniana.AAC.1